MRSDSLQIPHIFLQLPPGCHGHHGPHSHGGHGDHVGHGGHVGHDGHGDYGGHGGHVGHLPAHSKHQPAKCHSCPDDKNKRFPEELPMFRPSEWIATSTLLWKTFLQIARTVSNEHDLI